MERAAFRTKRKIFATLGADRRVNLVVQPAEQRDALLSEFPETFFSLGGWTRLGYLAVDLASVDEGLLAELLAEAHRDALPVMKASKAKRPEGPKRPKRPKR